ncbi:MAG: substrate-binding domain-containing protein [Devosia sp.]
MRYHTKRSAMRTMPAMLLAATTLISAPLALTVTTASFAQDACKPGTTKKIAFMLKQQTAFRYLNADVPAFTKTANDAGYEVLVQSAENDAQAQVAQAENVLTQGIDAIVIQPVDFNVAGQIAELALAANIPIASYDDLILNAKQTAFIGRDPKEGGKVAAEAVTKLVPKGNYVLIGGDAGQTGSTQMQDGYHVIVDPLVAKGDIKIVMDQFTPSWKTEPAQANAENALTQNNNDVQAFLVSYDGMSLGVLQAIEGAGIKPGTIAVTGQDMELSAAQAIVEGRQTGSVWPAPDEMAVAGAKAAIAMAQCKDIGATASIDNGAGQIPWVKTPIYFVGADKMAEFVCGHSFWLNIDEVYKNVPDKKPAC